MRARPLILLAMAAAGAAPAARAPAGAQRGAPARAAPCPSAFAPWPAGDAPEPELADARAGEALSPAWERRARSGTLLRFDGVVDAAGNVYWVEAHADDSGGEIVSATHDGALRFRAAAGAARIALAGPVLVAEAPGRGCRGLATPGVAAWRAADGAPAWRRDLLDALEAWMREPGDCRYGKAHALAVVGGRLLVAASILDADTREHESGYVALDAATGDVAWTARTSAEGNVAQSGAPRAAEDGLVYASRTVTPTRDPLLVLGAGAPPRELAPGPAALHGDVLAAHGALLVDEGRAAQDPTVASAATLEVRCRATAAPLGAFPASVDTVPLLLPGGLVLFGPVLSRHDAATGELLWRVRLGSAARTPQRGRSLALLRTEPVATRAGAVLFAEQAGSLVPPLARLEARPAVLREIDAEGRETLRRALPAGEEVYAGAAAIDRGRWFVAAAPYHGARGGVLRAFDVPGRSAAPRGWTTTHGSPARDDRAR